MNEEQIVQQLPIPSNIKEMLLNCPSLSIASEFRQLARLAVRDAPDNGWHEVAYPIPEKGHVKEARVCTVKNGISINYYEPYMRRRDPSCMHIGDDLPTDKTRFSDVWGYPFNDLREETVSWLTQQPLAIFFFNAGQTKGMYGMAVVPQNAGFFALGLALLQGIEDLSDKEPPRHIQCMIFTAPPFRHTHFNGKQVVVHNRRENAHEIFSYNLYPGPSAKKGVYSALLDFGEKENWLTLHASVVQMITPYDNKLTIMHEGASGSGKSEMHEHMHRESDGTIMCARNTITGETKKLVLPRACDLRPVVDDMGSTHPSIQKTKQNLYIADAEYGWFIRVNHIENYGTDPDIESRTIHPKQPLVYLNIDAKPGSTALLWEHIEDTPGTKCPNPRVIIPRNEIPDMVDKPVKVDIRSFGLRTPPSTSERPNYGILGMFHILPPAIAWVWRLVSPRGHGNPSIVGPATMESEGVGSFWPFATGEKVNFANMLLEQIMDTPKVHYILCPNQYIGAWHVGFMPQWIVREYIARRGGVKFPRKNLSVSRCHLLGYSLNSFTIEGQTFEREFFQTEYQHEMGEEAYDAGANILKDFFKAQLPQYRDERLHPIGKTIIDAVLEDAPFERFSKLIRDDNIFIDE